MKKIFFCFAIIVGILLNTKLIEGQGSIGIRSSDDMFSEMERNFNNPEEIPTPMDEYFIGRAVAANILTSYEIYNNTELTNYLNLICQALLINSSLPAAYNGYFVIVLNSQELNAFASPGGHIFITKGLVDITESEDALAGIIAHELAHIMLKHGMKTIEEMKFIEEVELMAERAAAVAGISSSRNETYRNFVNDFLNIIIRSGYTVPQELEADSTALKLLSAAGYLPGGLLDVFKILHDIQGDLMNDINNIYPALSERILNIENQMAIFRIPNNISARQVRFLQITGRN